MSADQEQTCPRRSEAPYQITPGPDRWDNRASLANGIGPSCSYCGSLNPDLFMEKVREGWIIEPTDKSYKAYLQQPYTAEDFARIKAGSEIWKAVKQLKLDEGLTEAEATAVADDDWEKHRATESKGATVAKFYYQHLTTEQRHEFIELHNSKAMKIGYPGRFYSVPFFCTQGPASG